MITDTRRDCGDVIAGEEVQAAFAVRNAGTAPLELAQKSTVGTIHEKIGRPVAAVWHANESLRTRRVAAMRVAPT